MIIACIQGNNHTKPQSYKATIAKANLVYKQKKKRNEAKQNTKAETV